MRKENGILQRLGALLLTFAMLVSMCPMKAAAVGDEIPLKYRIVRTTVRDTESSEDPKPILRYEYSVEFDGIPTPASGTAEYWWYVVGVTEQVPAANRAWDDRYSCYFEKGNDTISDTSCRTVMLNLKVDGLTLVGTIPSAAAAISDKAYSDWFTWGAVTTGWPSTVEIGVPFTLNAAAPDGNSGIGDTTITTDNVWGMPVETVDGKYVLTLNNTPGTGTLTRKHSVNDTWRATENLSTTISWPDYNATFALNGKTVTGDTAYISEASTITVTIPDSCGVTDAKYLPQIGTWSKEGTNWKTTVSVSESRAITVGNETLKVVVDGVTPTVTNVSAYVDGGETVVKFDYTVGASGIGSLTINGTEVTAPTGSSATIRISGTDQKRVTIELTSKAGKKDTTSCAVTPALSATLGELDAGAVVSVGYINKVSSIRVNVSGVPSNGSASVRVPGDSNPYAVTSGVATLPFAANGKTVTVTDNLGRTATVDIPSYTVDNVAPTVTVSAPDDGCYSDTTKQIKVTVEDTGVGLDTTKGSVKLMFANKNSVEVTPTDTGSGMEYAYTLEPGDRLLKIEVGDFYDLVGNRTTTPAITKDVIIDTQAPVVTLTASGNIVNFKSFAEKQWAILLPVTDNETGAPEAVSITARIEDENMDASVLTADGWRQDGTTFTKTFSVDVNKQANGELQVRIPAVDLAGNTPTSVTVKAGDGSTTELKWDDTEKAFLGTLYIDRRIPSENENDDVPKVTFSTTDQNYGIPDSELYKDSVTFTATIQDGGSGIADVQGIVNDSKLTLSQSGSGSTYRYQIAATDHETGSAMLSVTVKDNVGNGYTYTHAFGIDGKAPVVSVQPSIEAKGENGGTKYYDAEVTYTVTATDLFSNPPVMTKDGEHFDGLSDGKFTVADAMKSFVVTLTDKVGNSSSASVGKMVVDKTAPAISVIIKDAELNEVGPATGVVNSNLTYTFRVEEANLKALILKYTINNGDEQTKTLTDFTQNNDLYTHSVTLKDGERMTAWSVQATDWAAHTEDLSKSTNENLLVDTTAPQVTVSRSRNPEVPTTNVDYYKDDEVQYTITVKDANLDADRTTARAKITDSNGSDLSETIAFTAVDGNLVGTFELTDGLMLSELTIDVQDLGENRPKSIIPPTGITFADDDNPGIFVSENKAVVDATAPTAELSIASATDGVTVKGIYTFNGRNYLKLSGNKNKDVSVKATLTLSDANLDVPTSLSGWEIEQGPTVMVNNANNVITLAKTLTASKDDTKAITLSLTEKDVVGHPLTTGAVSGGVGDNTPSYETVADDSGIVTFDLTLDNRAPTSGSDSEAPVITVAPEAPYNTADGKPLYNNNPFDFTAKVKEDTAYKSGLDIVYYEVTDGSGVVTENNNTDESDIPDGVYEKNLTIPVALKTNHGETNSAKLRIEAQDNSGNGVALVKDFAVDNLAPRVSVVFDNNYVTNDTFFKEARTATVTVKDINLTGTVAAVSGSKDVFGGEWTGGPSEKSNTVTFDPGLNSVGEYTMSLSSTDLAQNTTNNEKVDYTGCAAPGSFIIDRKAPTVNVTRTSEAIAYTTNGDGPKTDFYNKPVTYSFKIQDNYLDNAAGGTQKVNITYTVNGTSKTVSLPAAEQGLTLETIDGLKTYTYSFTLGNEDVLTGITIEVVDNAGNSFREITGNVHFTNGIYTGHDVKVDTVAPKVKVERNGPDAVQTVGVHEIFGDAQTFTVTVSDANLVDTNGSLYKVFYTVNGEQKELPLTVNGGDGAASFKVSGSVSDLLDVIQILVNDAAGNSAVLDKNSPIKSFTAGEKGLEYNGKKMIVDCLAPTATFYATGPEIEYYYTNGSDAVFIKLRNPTNGTETEKGDVQVTAVLEVSDWNLSFNKGSFTVKSNNGGTLAGSDPDDWNEGVKIHKDGKVVYTKIFSVPYNETGLIELSLDVSDMAGHKLDQTGLAIASLNGTAANPNPLKVVDGKLTGAITLDRRQPTSGNDTEAPYIKLTPNPSPVGTSSNGRKLFNSSFDYSLYVTDGTNKTLNAGLKSVVWTLENANGVNSPSFITVNSGKSEIAQGVMETDETIRFTVGTDECNTCELHVTAEDYVGNKITYVEPFAVDTLAPRVKVEYDNNDVKNELYFKADRKATVTVEDINFNASATKINTQVGSSGWTHSADGKVHTAVCSYTVDGEYTFTMESTDLAGNATADNKVTYVGAAPQKFILDKTQPVIEVIYNPAEHIGMDDMGTLYYNVNTTATVKIKERNFRANDVISEFNNGKKLGAFTDGGNDSHSASVLFDQNNRYHFRIAYTDLAGNPAEPYSSPIFSVDTTAPVIDITEGDMTNEHLNIVPDDLVLQIRVKDQESNLESYAVKITYQNNRFEWITLNSGDYWTVTSEDGGNTIYINFANILKEKSQDGVYTVEVSGRDYAGNVTELTPPLVFSLNRFGSSFVISDPFTIDFLRTTTEGIAYHNSVDQRLVFLEVNPNRVYEDEAHKLEGSALTLMVNGASRRLQRDQDYTVAIEEHNSEDQAWFVYTYTIEPAAFMDGGELQNGRNTILIYGEDEAGNQNTNESNTPENANLADGEVYTGKIEFVLDTMPPVITTVGIESNTVYNAESQQMKIDVSDSTPVALKVYLNDQELTLSQEPVDNSVVWMTRDETMGTYTVNVPQDNNLFSKQTLRVTVVDAATNEAEAYVREFYVTTNPFIQLMNNIWLLGVCVLVLAGVIFLTVVTIRKRKTKAAK